MQGDTPALNMVVIGSLPPPIGGTTVALQLLVDFLISQNFHVVTFNISESRKNRKWLIFGRLANLIGSIYRSNIVTLHTSDRGTTTAGPIIWLICRLLGKPLVLRQFGGSLWGTFGKLRPIHRWIVTHSVLRSHSVLLETKQLVSLFNEITEGRAKWFPNCRFRSRYRYQGRFANGRSDILKCLYVGRIARSKGVLIGAAATSQVEGTTLSACGPLDDLTLADLATASVKYLGSIPADRVPELMSGFDVLLLPTNHDGEGYPGVLIEAAQVGLPIIVTDWGAIPEMFMPDEVRYISTDSLDALVGEIRSLKSQPILLKRLSCRVAKRSEEFEAASIYQQFTDMCRQLAASGSKSIV